MKKSMSSSSTAYKWDREKWLEDPTWWEPYNKAGRLKGKGQTTRARQMRRALETPEEREARKAKREEEKKAASEKEAKKESPGASEKEAGSNKGAFEKGASSKPPQAASEKEAESKPPQAASEKEEKKESPGTFEKEAESNTGAPEKGASSKPPQAASEKEVKPFESRHATYKEVLEGWKDKEKRLEGGHSTDGEWQVVQRPRPKKRHWQLKAAKPKNGYIPVGSDSSSSTPAAKASKPEPLKKVAIDWHNVIQLTSPQRGDYILNSHIRAIWDMQSNGFQVVVISYCFAKRAASVKEWAASLPVRFDKVITTTKKTGWQGKAQLARKEGCEWLIDDDVWICREAKNQNLKVYPIETWDEKHCWVREYGDQRRYRDLVEAAQDLISEYGD